MNVVCLVGRLTADPEVKVLPSGMQIANMRIAVDRPVAKDSGEQTADFINCTGFGKTAEFAGKYLTKGQKISVNGRLQIRDYNDKDGNKRTAAEVLATEIRGVERQNAGGGENFQPAGRNAQIGHSGGSQRVSRPFDEEEISDPFAE